MDDGCFIFGFVGDEEGFVFVIGYYCNGILFVLWIVILVVEFFKNGDVEVFFEVYRL